MTIKLLKNLCLCFGVLATSALHAQNNFDDVEVEILQVRENIYMLVTPGAGNITVQVGDEGVLIVDTQFAPLSEKILAKIRELSDGPLRFIINTHHHGDHTGGNANLRAAGSTVVGGNVGGDIADAGEGAQIIAHENALLHMVTPAEGQPEISTEAWPTLTFFNEKRDMWFNDEGIRVIHEPSAHTDGDSIVYFRQSDVISTGDVYVTNNYPIIDLASGGSIQGFIAAANSIIDLIIPVYGQDGGTLVIPGHGRLSDLGDVINWREMLTIIRDRIQDMVDRGMSLEEVQAARPTRDYDPRWGVDSSFWSTEQFVAAVYQNLSSTEEGSP
ncbi:MAG: MBL fold metallo-hydrolase [Pseudomonadota bacterium]